jgi:TolB-like protein
VAPSSFLAADRAAMVDALAQAAEQAFRNVPERSRIAIVYITAQDRNTTDYLTGELEHICVNGGYAIIDRSQLHLLREEQNFQLSGEVDDATAVKIGHFAGAEFIVTGAVGGEGALRRLNLRVLDTQMGQVVGFASEQF